LAGLGVCFELVLGDDLRGWGARVNEGSESVSVYEIPHFKEILEYSGVVMQ
jgi:hypothetical protein